MRKVVVLLAVIALVTVQSACSSPAPATLTVQGACEMCKERIEDAAKSVDGVLKATWMLESKELHLHFDAAKTSLEAISQAIAKAGHDTEKDKAADSVYNALPPCCKYRG
jgi:Cu(I)/Ag(I) efflux system membrane fusion protein